MTNKSSNPERSGPLVSVVLPVRDGLPYLPAAVNSILDQTYENFELIVIDDGSVDETRDWLSARSLQDERLHFLDNQGNGLVDALNYGISHAKGAYIARMDADDIAMPRRFERQVKFLETNPLIAVLGTQVLPMPSPPSNVLSPPKPASKEYSPRIFEPCK